jgi:hypothetical protein
MMDLRVWSASMPIVYLDAGGGSYAVLPATCPRPWNGRALTVDEMMRCKHAFETTLAKTQDLGLAAQAAYEYLSAECW